MLQKIDDYRGKFLILDKIDIKIEQLKILHITNLNERHNGRLFTIQVEELIMG